MPLFRTEPEDDGLLVYKHCTPPEWRPAHCLGSSSDFCKWLSSRADNNSQIAAIKNKSRDRFSIASGFWSFPCRKSDYKIQFKRLASLVECLSLPIGALSCLPNLIAWLDPSVSSQAVWPHLQTHPWELHQGMREQRARLLPRLHGLHRCEPDDNAQQYTRCPPLLKL